MLYMYLKQINIWKFIFGILIFILLRIFLNYQTIKDYEALYEAILPYILSFLMIDISVTELYAYEKCSSNSMYKISNYKLLSNMIIVIPIIIFLVIFESNYVLLFTTSYLVFSRIMNNLIILTKSKLISLLLLLLINFLWFDARVPALFNFYTIYLDYSIIGKVNVVLSIIISEFFVRRTLND